MKKMAKIFLLFSAVLAIPVFINRFIFSSVNRKQLQKDGQHTYKWKYGNIFYWTKGKGKPLLLVHGIGTGASHLEWEQSVSMFSKRYRVYAIDLLGFGLSDKPNISYSSYLYCSLIDNFLRDIVKEPAFVVGSGHGASFLVGATALSDRFIKKIVLIAPSLQKKTKFICSCIKATFGMAHYWNQFIQYFKFPHCLSFVLTK